MRALPKVTSGLRLRDFALRRILMSDADVLREESELRQCLEALLQNAGVLNTNEKLYLHRAEVPESGYVYVLTSHSEVTKLLAKQLTGLAGIVNPGPVWIVTRAEIRKIIYGWSSLQEVRKN